MSQSETAVVDVAFPLAGASLPLDHGYLLFAALSGVVPALHKEAAWGVHPVRGTRTGPGELKLDKSSLLKVRLPAGRIADLLALTGATLAVSGHSVRVGVPRVYVLEPRAALRARFVTVKHAIAAADDLHKVLKLQLADVLGGLEAAAKVAIAVGARRVIRVAERTIVGWSVALDGLDTVASLAVQAKGLGGRRHMGAGIFVPFLLQP